jgi:hypothetical protein
MDFRIPFAYEPAHQERLLPGDVREKARGFFTSADGRAFLRTLASLTPVDDVPDAAKFTLAAGYRKVFRDISLLLQEPTSPQGTATETYPDLDDDTKWKQ